MKKYLLVTSLVAALFTGTLFAAPSAHAQAAKTQPGAPNSGQALEIGPPVVNLAADPGQTVKAQISLRDVSTTKLVVTNQINDFVANGEDGTPKILLNQKEDEQNPYSIKSWIAPLPQFTLVPKQIQILNISIKVPSNAAPGGYYGVIRFTGTPPDLEGTGVSLSASLGTLVLLRVNGDAKEELSVEEFSASKNGRKNWLFESGPITLTERIKNSGNLHEQPVGTVVVKDMFGKDVASVAVNNPARNILPSSIRKFSQTLDSSVIGNRQLFGKYTATMTIRYGEKGSAATSTTTFWVIPYTLIAIIVIALIVLGVAIRFGIKRYNTYIIGQAKRRR